MTPAMDLEGGRSMEWFFEQWVRGTGIPHYRVEFSTHHSEKGELVRGKLFQTDVPRYFITRVPLYAHNGSGQMFFSATSSLLVRRLPSILSPRSRRTSSSSILK